MFNDPATPHLLVAPPRNSRIPRQPCRGGFTLVELLVVIAIIVALSAIMLAVLPKTESKLAADGAAQLQAWLGNARSRAVRDQAPTGLRLLPATGPGAPAGSFGSAQLIQTPEPFTWPTQQITVQPPSSPRTQRAYFSPPAAGFPNLTTGTTNTIQPGDYLEISSGVGSIHQITHVPVTDSVLNRQYVPLASQPPTAAITALTTTNWRIIRQPQPLMGEPALEFPNTVVVYGNSSAGAAPGSQNVPSTTTGNWDIIFAPSGQVINATSGRIVLWVWDVNRVSAPTLLTIYTNTGAVAAHPVGPQGSEFTFTQDGKSSGQ